MRMPAFLLFSLLTGGCGRLGYEPTPLPGLEGNETSPLPTPSESLSDRDGGLATEDSGESAPMNDAGTIDAAPEPAIVIAPRLTIPASLAEATRLGIAAEDDLYLEVSSGSLGAELECSTGGGFGRCPQSGRGLELAGLASGTELCVRNRHSWTVSTARCFVVPPIERFTCGARVTGDATFDEVEALAMSAEVLCFENGANLTTADSDGITLEGGRHVFLARAGATVTITNMRSDEEIDPWAAHVAIYFLDAPDSRIVGLDVMTGGYLGDAIRLERSPGTQVVGNTIETFGDHGFGIRVMQSMDVRTAANDIVTHNQYGRGIEYAQDSDRGLVERNTIHVLSDLGNRQSHAIIFWDGSDDCAAIGNDCTTTGNYGDGLKLDATAMRAVAHDNVFRLSGTAFGRAFSINAEGGSTMAEARGNRICEMGAVGWSSATTVQDVGGLEASWFAVGAQVQVGGSCP